MRVEHVLLAGADDVFDQLHRQTEIGFEHLTKVVLGQTAPAVEVVASEDVRQLVLQAAFDEDGETFDHFRKIDGVVVVLVVEFEEALDDQVVADGQSAETGVEVVAGDSRRRRRRRGRRSRIGGRAKPEILFVQRLQFVMIELSVLDE